MENNKKICLIMLVALILIEITSAINVVKSVKNLSCQNNTNCGNKMLCVNNKCASKSFIRKFFMNFYEFFSTSKSGITFKNETINKTSMETLERDLIRREDIEQLKIALQRYYEDNGKYPFTDKIKLTGEDNALVKALSPNYIMYNQKTYNSFPLDPLNPEYFYTYKSDGNGYVLIANLETKGNITITEGTINEDFLKQNLRSGYMKVTFTDRFSVEAVDVNLKELFDEISSKTGVNIIGEIPEDYNITVYIKNRGFTLGMKDILAKIKPGEYSGNLKIGKVFSESTYYIYKKSNLLINNNSKIAVSINKEGEIKLSQNKIDEAYSLFIKSLRYNSKYLPAHKNLVIVNEKQERYDYMIKRIQKIIVLEPSNMDNYRILANAYKLDGQYGNALKNYIIFLENSKENNPYINEVNNNINQIKNNTLTNFQQI